MWLTTGTGFGRGNSFLGPELCDESVRRTAAREAKDIAKFKKKEDGKRLVICTGNRALYDMNTTIGFKWTNEKLKAAINYKRKKDDKRPIPTKKDKRVERWAPVRRNNPPMTKATNSLIAMVMIKVMIRMMMWMMTPMI